MALEKVIKSMSGRKGYPHPMARLGMNYIAFSVKAMKTFKLHLFNAVEIYVDEEKKKLGFNPLVALTDESYNLVKHSMIGARNVYRRFDFLHKFLIHNAPKECSFKVQPSTSDNEPYMFWIKIT
jgi:hypothetical protein